MTAACPEETAARTGDTAGGPLHASRGEVAAASHVSDCLARLVAGGHLGLADGDVQVVAHDDEWPLAFAAVHARLAPVAGDARIAHIGSTSVPGMPGKPLVDVSVGLAEGSALGAEPASAAGLVFRAVNPEAVLFALYAPLGLRIANVHVRYRDTGPERWDLLWRDYLRAHPREVAAYAEAKEAAARLHHQRQGYSAAKGRFITAAATRARAWAARTEWAAPSG